MKYAAFFMIALVVIGLALGVYTYVNAKLTLVSISVTAARGYERNEDFTALQNAMDNNALLGTPYADALPGAGTDYNFETYTLRLKNGGLIAADMVEIQPIPLEGDMLSFSTLDAVQVNANHAVAAGEEKEIACTLLVRADQDELLRHQRRFRVTYYIWGISRTETVRYE